MAVFFVGASEFMLVAMLGPLSAAFQTSATSTAWLISSYAFSYAIAAPLLGYLSDRVDRRKLLHIALLAFAIDGIGIAFAPSLAIAIGLRIFGGIASAVIIPTVFALISESMPKERQASAMGIVLLGMTFGIAFGPANAGLLTALLDWRAPFLVTSFGCVLACAASLMTAPRRAMKPHKVKIPRLAWCKQWSVLRPLIAKAAWNGTGVSAFLLSGQVLEHRYDFGVAQIGMSVMVFGVGLGLGNLSAGRLRSLLGREERSLVVLTVVLLTSITLFMLVPLPITGALVCLTCWGAALGAGAPLSTVVVAARSGPNKGMALACAETLNQAAILAIVPFALMRLLHIGENAAMWVFAVGLGVGIVLTLFDAVASSPRYSTPSAESASAG
jgi:predicted MFS family arabinose efflux permease